MINTMRSQYAAPFMRAFKQAPWRSQTQAVAMLSITLLTVAVVGGFYLAVAARAATAGRDLQALEVRKAALAQDNDRLQAELAGLRSVTRLAARAEALGFTPATTEQLDYLRVDNYPTNVTLAPPPRAAIAPEPGNTLTNLNNWLSQVLQGLVAGWPHAAGAGQ